MADHGWGPTPSHAEAGEANGGTAFNTTELQEALPVNNNQAQEKPQTPAGWVQASAYDYNAYGKDAEHTWDSNARVYEWDGENGDIGPEVPELEIQLFGEPGKRGKQGIDFSK
jgi:ATP-dependent RNA helicase DDX3X